jgi:hypothetical protein
MLLFTREARRVDPDETVTLFSVSPLITIRQSPLVTILASIKRRIVTRIKTTPVKTVIPTR